MGKPDLLDHVLTEHCSDPDCEIHNIDVAMEEEVVSRSDVAFFVAGTQLMRFRGNNTVARAATINDLAKNYLREGE